MIRNVHRTTCFMGQILKPRTTLFSRTEGVCAYHGTHMMRHASVDAWAQEIALYQHFLLVIKQYLLASERMLD